MSETSKKERGINWTHEEIVLLSEFVRQYSDKLFGTSYKGKKATANVEKVKVHYWKKAAQVLIENGSHPRSYDKVRKKWQDISSKASMYHRESQRTGGGEKPPENKTFEVVLTALQPVAKDGIISQEEGESDPLPPEEDLLEQVAYAISQVESNSNQDASIIMELESCTEEDVTEIDKAPTKSTVNTSASKGPHTDQIILLEKERLRVDLERLQVDKEQLQVSRQIQSSLNEISQNLQLFLQFSLEKHGVTVIRESEY